MVRLRWVCRSIATISSLLLVFLSVESVPALPNGQRTIAIRSDEFRALRILSVEQGLALPFTSGPIPEAEIRATLDRIDFGALSPAGRNTFEWILQQLEPRFSYQEEDGAFGLRSDVELSLETYLHSDSSNRDMEYSWEERKPLLRIPLEFWVLDNGYAVFDLGFRKNIPDFSGYPTYNSAEQYTFDSEGVFEFQTEETDPWTNVPYIIDTMDVQFPQRAFLSVGGNRWNVQLGRDKIDWGNGYTGNLYISDYADWYDSLQFSTFWDRFKFSWLWASLDGKLMDDEREYKTYQYDINDDGDYDDPEDITVYEADSEVKSVIAQRWEIRLWNRLGLVYTEGMIFGRAYPTLEEINPLYHYHSLFANTRGTGNVHRSFEFNVATFPGLNFYAVISPDQWTSPLEPQTDLTDEPNAVAYLAGLDYVRPLGQGYLQGILEVVYATPWFGVHNSPLTSITTRRYVKAEHGIGRSQVWYDKPLGHYGGNDFALIWLDLSYRVPGEFHFGLNTYYEGDGSVPLNALLQSRYDDSRDSPTEEDATLTAPSEGYDGAVAQWKAVLSLYGEMEPWQIPAFNTAETGRTLSVSSELSAQWMKNRYNLPHDWQFDLQWILSTTVGL